MSHQLCRVRVDVTLPTPSGATINKPPAVAAMSENAALRRLLDRSFTFVKKTKNKIYKNEKN